MGYGKVNARLTILNGRGLLHWIPDNNFTGVVRHVGVYFRTTIQTLLYKQLFNRYTQPAKAILTLYPRRRIYRLRKTCLL